MAEPNFRADLKRGFVYTAIAKYSGILISLGVTAVLSRLLPPKDFGVIAVAFVFITFFSIFSDMGLSSAIVQKRNLTKSDLKSLFSFTAYVGLLLAIIFFFASWPIAEFYNDTQLIIICQLLSVNVFFATLVIVPNGLLFRDKRFKFIGIRTIVIQLIFAIISVAAALFGAGIYALLINPIGSAVLLFFISYAKYPVGFSFVPRLEAIRKVASYSVYTFGFSIINYFTRNLDKLLIGKAFGMSPLGYYEKSYRLMLLPVQNLTQVITPVLHPALADYQNNIKSQVYKYLKLIEILAIIGFPISVFLFFSSEDLILIVFGKQWMPSVPVFQILSLSVGLQICGSSSGSFYLATNKTKQLFYIGCANTLVNVSGLFIGIYCIGSVEGVAVMWVATMLLGFWNNWYFAKVVTHIPVIDTFKPYLPAILPSVIAAIMIWPINNLFGEPNIFNLLSKALITSLIILFFLRKNKIFDIISFLKLQGNKLIK